MGVDVLIYRSFSELKLSALFSWGMFDGENKCFDQGTALLHGGADGVAWEITPVLLKGLQELQNLLQGYQE